MKPCTSKVGDMEDFEDLLIAIELLNSHVEALRHGEGNHSRFIERPPFRD